MVQGKEMVSCHGIMQGKGLGTMVQGKEMVSCYKGKGLGTLEHSI
jgi:hypothetical protein